MYALGPKFSLCAPGNTLYARPEIWVQQKLSWKSNNFTDVKLASLLFQNIRDEIKRKFPTHL